MRRQHAFLDQLSREPEMAGVEGLDLGLDAHSGHQAAHGAQHARRVGHHIVGLGEVHRAAIERADFRQALIDMFHALRSARHVRALLLERQRLFRRPEHHVAAHAGGKVEHHVDIGLADALGDFPVVFHLAARRAGFGIAHMAMDDGSPRLRRVDRRTGDLFRRARHMRAAVLGRARAGDGAGDEDFAVHLKRHGNSS